MKINTYAIFEVLSNVLTTVKYDIPFGSTVVKQSCSQIFLRTTISFINMHLRKENNIGVCSFNGLLFQLAQLGNEKSGGAI